MTPPRISIVTPVYNNEETIEELLASVTGQSLSDIEIIVVDDGSDDCTIDLVNEIAEKDSRVKILQLPSNKGPYQARKVGVLASSGQYVLFLDGDDCLVPQACKMLSAFVEKNSADIIHFGMQINPSKNINPFQVINFKRWVTPFHGCFKGRDVLDACLIEEKYCWNLCGKLFEGDLCRKAFSFCSDTFFSRAEDFCAYLMCAFFAQSYIGVPEYEFYIYNYGFGGDGKTNIVYSDYEKKWLHLPQLLKEFSSFMCSECDEYEANRYIIKLQEIFIRDSVETLYAFVDQEFYSCGYDDLMRLWPDVSLLSQIAVRAWEDQGLVARDTGKATVFSQLSLSEKQVAGLYYSEITEEEEIHSLFKIITYLKQKKYSVVLLVDVFPEQRLSKLFRDIEIVALQPRFPEGPYTQDHRYKAWDYVIRKYSIDTVFYGQWLSHLLIWDIMLLKQRKIPILLCCEVAFARPLRGLRSYFSTQPYVFKLCDGFLFHRDHDEEIEMRGALSGATKSLLISSRVLAMVFRKRTQALPSLPMHYYLRTLYNACPKLLLR